MSAHLPDEAEIVVNGERKRLRLTLGALAEIEDAFGGDFEALRARLKNPRVSDLLMILHALIAGGGAPLALDALKASDIDFAAAAAAVAKAFRCLSQEAPGKPAEKKRDGERASPGRNGSSSERRS